MTVNGGHAVASKIIDRIFKDNETKRIPNPDYLVAITEFESAWQKGGNPLAFEMYVQKKYPEYTYLLNSL